MDAFVLGRALVFNMPCALDVPVIAKRCVKDPTARLALRMHDDLVVRQMVFALNDAIADITEMVGIVDVVDVSAEVSEAAEDFVAMHTDDVPGDSKFT